MSRGARAIVGLLLAAAAWPAAAGAHERPPGGLLEVRLATGAPLLTHGADPRPADAVATATSVLGAAQRAPACAPAYAQHVLYGRPARAADRSNRVRPLIDRLLREADAQLDRAAMESGGRHADYRVVCDAAGAVDIGTFVSRGDDSFASVVDAARAAGADDPLLDYTIFYDDPASTACGIGSYAPDSRARLDNVNNAGRGYAIVYPPCWDTTTLMHEVGHTQGAVPPDAPHGTGRLGHCLDEADVMCYADGGDRDSGVFLRCRGHERFDCGYDDYFDTAPEPGEYLADHWNLGSPLNRFLRFSDPAAGAGASAQPAGAVPAPDPSSSTAAARLTVARKAVVLRAGRVRVGLSCPGGRVIPCSGTLVVRDAAGRQVARRSVSLDSGVSSTVRVSVRRRMRVRLRRAHGTPRLRVLVRGA